MEFLNEVVEGLTAIALLVGRYGAQQVVGALTGQQELGTLASELFGALATSENRLSSQLAEVERRLADIEQRLDEVLEQRYEHGITAGLRKLLTVAMTTDSRLRADELIGACERFEDAAAAARTLLQTAAAERYVMVCALGLGRLDAALAAWGQLNAALTIAAIDYADAVRESYKIAKQRLVDRGEDRGAKYAGQGDFRGRHYEKRAKAEEQRVRDDAAQAIGLVGRLLDESAALGMAVGHPQPPRITWRIQPRKTLLTHVSGSVFPSWVHLGGHETRWLVEPVGPGPARFGALLVSWERFKPQKGTLTNARHLTPLPDHVGFTVNVKRKITVQAHPPIPRSIPIVHPGAYRAQQIAGKASGDSRTGHELMAGAHSCEVSDMVAVATDERGRLVDPSSIRVGPVTFMRYTG
ncbi:hypothetical protein [Amycolatopsis sp. NPDC003731]